MMEDQCCRFPHKFDSKDLMFQCIYLSNRVEEFELLTCSICVRINQSKSFYV